MKKLLILLTLVALLIGSCSLAYATDGYINNIVKEDHKIKNKWDINGSFVAHEGYNWGGFLEEGATWDYSIHIKEAKNGDVSVGSIRFTSGDVEVIGHVKAAKYPYRPEKWNDLAAVGTAVYDDITYNFMFVYSEIHIWFAISTSSYKEAWEAGTLWPKGERLCQLHSKMPDGIPPMDPKVIHE